MTQTFSIRHATLEDVPALLEIHNWAVRELDAIWSEVEDTLEQRIAWFHARQTSAYPILIGVDADGALLGYASYGQFRPKSGYALTMEHSIYLYPQAQGTGLARALMQQLIDEAKASGMHVLVAVIEAKNTASVRFHEKFGFEKTGFMAETGFKHGQWLSQVNMTLKLNDASAPQKGS